MKGILQKRKNIILGFIPELYSCITHINHLAPPELHCLLGYKKTKKLQFNESVPQLNVINTSNCGMLELLYDIS
jgi:hypothetical protein